MGLSTVLKAAPRKTGSGGLPGRLRREGLLPAVFYGPGLERAQSLSLDYKEFKTALTVGEGNRSLYTLHIEGQEPQAVLLKDYQVDPLSRKVIHADFYKLDPTRPVTLKVPLTLVGKPAGVEKGGQLQPGLREAALSVRPEAAPAELTVDVSGLGLGQTLHLSQVEAPGEARLVFAVDLPVATVAVPKGVKAESETEGEAAAPAAAGGKATAAAAGGKAPAGGGAGKAPAGGKGKGKK